MKTSHDIPNTLNHLLHVGGFIGLLGNTAFSALGNLDTPMLSFTFGTAISLIFVLTGRILCKQFNLDTLYVALSIIVCMLLSAVHFMAKGALMGISTILAAVITLLVVAMKSAEILESY